MKSLNSKFRNKSLNRHWFRTMNEARAEIDAGRDHYNHVRPPPHSSLNYLPFVEFAQRTAYVETHERVVLIQGTVSYITSSNISLMQMKHFSLSSS
ncbi:Transposase [Halomonas sp. R57-5]|nr:Transposase [Halomonas sp. R57-5]